MSKKQIPNILSTIRLLMVPLFAWIFFSDIPNNGFWAVAVFIAAGLTDILDGYLARRNNWITDVGKILDPFADKLMQFTAFVCLTIKNRFLLWLVILVAVKECCVLIVWWNIPTVTYVCAALSGAVMIFAFVMYIRYYYRQFFSNTQK